DQIAVIGAGPIGLMFMHAAELAGLNVIAVLKRKEQVAAAKLFGANKEYIEREIPHISQLMRPSIEDVLENTDVVVIGNKAEEFRSITGLLRPDQIVIDLVRLFDDKTTGGSYYGICW
ncbi:MAG: NAD(P)-binding domain-containing protein, partial [Candidatus Udaeobacter sp.]